MPQRGTQQKLRCVRCRTGIVLVESPWALRPRKPAQRAAIVPGSCGGVLIASFPVAGGRNATPLLAARSELTTVKRPTDDIARLIYINSRRWRRMIIRLVHVRLLPAKLRRVVLQRLTGPAEE